MSFEEAEPTVREESHVDYKIGPHPGDLLFDVGGESLVDFLEITDDLVFIHAYDRPELVAQQILSFITNREAFKEGHYQAQEPYDRPELKSKGVDRKILFTVVDDSDQTPRDYYQGLLEELDISLPKGLKDRYRISYVDKAHQKALIDECPRELDIKWHVSDLSSGKIGGVRGIQNISEVLAYFYGGLSRKTPIIHKFDDDIFLGNVNKSEGKLLISDSYDFFARSAQVLSDPAVRYLGRKYDGDSPSPIYTLSEAIEIFHRIFTSSADLTDGNIKSDLSQILNSLPLTTPNVNGVGFKQIPPWMRRAINEQLLTPGFPGQAGTLENFIRAYLTSSLVLLQKGINHMSMDNTPDGEDWFGKVGIVPGGAVSYRLNDRLPSSPPFANQDVLRSALQHGMVSGSVIGDRSVLHMKSEGRPPLLTDLSTGIGNPRHTFLLTVCVIEAMEEYLQHQGKSLHHGLAENKTIFADLINFGGEGRKFIDRLTERVEVLSKALENGKAWWNKDANNQMAVKALEIYINSIKAHLPEIVHEFLADQVTPDLRTTARELLEWWVGLDSEWQKALDFYKDFGRKLKYKTQSPKPIEKSIIQPKAILFDLHRRDNVLDLSPPSSVRAKLKLRFGEHDVVYPGQEEALIQEALSNYDENYYMVREISPDQISSINPDLSIGEGIFSLVERLCFDWQKETEGILSDHNREKWTWTFGTDGMDYRYDAAGQNNTPPSKDLYFMRIGTSKKDSVEERMRRLNERSDHQKETYREELQKAVIDQEKLDFCYFSLYKVPQSGPWTGTPDNRPHVKVDGNNTVIQELLITKAFPGSQFLKITQLGVGGVLIERRDRRSIAETEKTTVAGFVLILDNRLSSQTVHGRVLPVIRFKK